MNQNKNKKINVTIIYGIIFLVMCVFLFILKSDKKSFLEFFNLGYFIPIVIYSGFAISISYLLFDFLSRIMNKILSFIISLVFGIPTGIVIINKLFVLFTKINM